ncbi:hypothetical protein [Nocardia sp.]|nr:hypothetical protein [Nocardia sp.]
MASLKQVQVTFDCLPRHRQTPATARLPPGGQLTLCAAGRAAHMNPRP